MNNLHDFTINLYLDGMNIVYLSPQTKHQSITSVKMLTYTVGPTVLYYDVMYSRIQFGFVIHHNKGFVL